MVLGNTNIGTYDVCCAVGINSGDIGTLCTAPTINVWSKWKPIESKVDTMTLDELDNQRYGVSIIEANTPKFLVDNINNNGGLGFKYKKPITKYRLGDFRNYNSDAPIPCEKTYIDKEEINIGGVTNQNHGSYERDCGGLESQSSENTLGVEDLYHFTDSITGQDLVLRRGFYITDGKNSAWYTDKFYWWTTDMQKFANKDVTIYEFYTNCIKGSDGLVRHIGSDSIGAWGTDRFYAIPFPKYTKHIQSKTPAGSKIVATILLSEFTRQYDNQSMYDSVKYDVYFDARGEVYRGGRINNVWIKLCRDKKGIDAIESNHLANAIDIEKGSYSQHYTGVLKNRPKNVYEEPSPNVYAIVYWNEQIQTVQIPMATRPDVPYIIRNN